MGYGILYHPLVAEDIRKIPANLRDRIRSAIENRLMTDPVKAGKPLRQSLSGHRKMRIGDYRLIYRLELKTIIILKIGHRKDVYEKAVSRLTL